MCAFFVSLLIYNIMEYLLEYNSFNTPEQNIIKTLTGKKVLFLESDYSLNDGLDEFERILQRGNIDYKILFGLQELPLQEIIQAINETDCIVFMTQWVYDISKTLLDYIKQIKEKKIIVEVYIDKPTWFSSRQHGTHHDVYIYTCFMYWDEPEKDTEKFYKLTDVPFWDYKNGFDS